MNSTVKAPFSLNRAGSILRAVSRVFAARRVSADRDGSSPSSGRRPGRRLAIPSLVAMLTVAAVFAFSGSALAVLTHPFLASFDGSDTPDGSLGAGSSGSADKLAVDQTSGDVWVIDKDHQVLDKFDSSGSYISQIAFGSWSSDPDIAVDNSSTGTQGNVAAAAEFGDVRVFDSSGSPLFSIPASGNTTPDGDFDDDCGLAIDPSNGDIYVAEYGQQAIDKFDSTGSFIAQFPVGFGVCDIAVDTDGTIWAVEWNQSLHKLDSSGVDQGVIDPNNPSAVNVDLSTHHVYSDRRGSIAEYDSSGVQQIVFGSADLTNSRGVDVNGSTGMIYATSNPAGQNSRVVIFGPGVVVPGVVTGDATNLTASAATLNGTVNPDGVQVTDCHFEYGTTTDYELGSVPCVETPAEIGSGSSDVSVHADITGLVSETTYHFRLAAANANGINHGEDRTFTTLGAVGATTEPATNITKTSATLNGSVNPLGAQLTDCHFEYGTTTAYELGSVPCVPDAASIPPDSTFHSVSADITGLTAGTLYHFRLVATTANGTKQANDLTFTTVQPLVVTTEAATNVEQTTATLNGSVNPLGDTVTDCHFEYGTDTSYGTNVPCAETVGGGSSDVPVHADITGLTPGTVYHYRLVATNAFGTREGQDVTFLTPTVPTIVAISVPCVDADSALLVAQVRGGFDPTATVHFEYGTDTNYGTSTPDQIIDPSGGNDPKTVFVELTGLQANTTYHFIVVAENQTGTTTSTDQTFSTANLSPCGLPDNRAYEQVSPQDKGGIDVLNSDVAAALSGNAASFDSFGSFGEATGAGIISSYVSTRGSSGWSTEMVSPPIPLNALLATAIPLDYSPELDMSISQVGGLVDPAFPFYVRDSSGQFLQATPDELAAPATYDGAPDDFSRVVFEVNQALVPGAPAGGATNIYVCSQPSASEDCSATPTAGGGQLELVSMLPGETPDPGGGTTGGKPRSVSADASGIFWTSNSDGEIYVRKDLSSTDQVSASQASPPDPNGDKQKTFQTATPDGAMAFFTSPEKLTDDATTGPTSTGNDLYRYNVDTGDLVDLTVDNAGNATGGARVQGVLRVSDDGQRVYFVARGVLAAGASLDDMNLYVRDGSTTTFIATLQDVSTCSTFGGVTDACNWSGNETIKSSRLTPDGQTLLFVSNRSQLGYDNAGHVEVYRYDLQDGLSCISCNPTGATADAALNPPVLLQGLAFTEAHNLSDNGSRVFFTTPEPLTDGDVNNALDVYEWVEGSGLHLISTGRSTEPISGQDRGAQFANASASGNDVFFVTRQQLVATDQDDNVDLYDARVNGGFPSQPPVVCVGDACKPPPTGAPTPPPAGSSTTTGPGNQPKDTTPSAGKKKKKKCKQIKNKKKRKKCIKKKKSKRRAH